MPHTLNRREFVGAAAVLPALSAGRAPGIEPYFPSAAHQMVWRNWDLVPSARIAEALGTVPEKVQALARSLGLERQQVPARYLRRLRFKTLCRNWDFVPYSQLTTLAGMTEAEIGELLRHDAFYVAHLGPKPDCPPVRVEGAQSAAPAHFRPALRGPEEERFGFLRELERPVARNPWAGADGRYRLAPRLAFPYPAVFGDILKEDDFESYYPAGVLENMARLGLSAIWLHVVLRDLAKSEIFAEFGKDRAVRLRRLNWLIAEAKRQGLGVYLYLNEPRAMPEEFFGKHPEIKGAPGHPGDGLRSMCTTTEPVKKYLVEASATLFREAPGLEGVFLITASENPTNCYSVAKEPACARCRARKPAEVIGEVVRLVEEGARRTKPEAHIIAWDWSWNFLEPDPQEQIIAALPRTVTLMVDFERGSSIAREGVRSVVDEYSLSVVGPSPRAAAQLRQARERGMQTMAKTQVGNTWELGLLPYIPVAALVARKFQAMHAAGVAGVMASWTLGTYPSPNWSVAQAFYREAMPGVDAALEKVAADLYGREGASQVVKAWKIFAEAFEQYPFTNGLVYSSVVQWGPAHPWWLELSGKRPRILRSYDDLGWTRPFGPDLTARVFEGIAREWRRGVALLEAVRKPAPAAARDLAISRAVGLYFASIANHIRFHALRGQAGSGVRQKALLADEIRIATEFLSICNADSRVGYEPSMQYFYLPLDVREKIAACRYYMGGL